ncbi:MAG: ribonuclease HII [Clostridia bacterium]|nr:ribonuclease HII [Clostridia bacterium]MDY6185197.1 ribonuclease HII [Eubacteriales bacterium]
MPDYSFELAAREAGYQIVCGIDEAGRGPLSGPVVAAACVLDPTVEIPGLNDSKKLSPAKRELLFERITESALDYAIGMASPEEIDRLNILNATMLAMRRAIAGLKTPADFALVDGNCTRDFPIPARAIVKGDALSCSISAASILAKVTRDRLCLEDEKNYPQYGFAKHKGYGTAEHIAALKQYGPCPIHRKTFLKFLSSEE